MFVVGIAGHQRYEREHAIRRLNGDRVVKEKGVARVGHRFDTGERCCNVTCKFILIHVLRTWIIPLS